MGANFPSQDYRAAVSLDEPRLDFVTFAKFGERLLLAFCFAAPLSIALSQTIVVAYILHSIVCSVLYRGSLRSPAVRTISVPILSFIAIASISSVVGIDAPHAVPELLKTAFYLILPFSVYLTLTVSLPTRELAESASHLLTKCLTFFTALILGQSIAAIHTIIDPGFGPSWSLKPPGPVTESGQLVFVLTFLMFALYYIEQFATNAPQQASATLTRLLSLMLFGWLLVLAWPEQFAPQTIAYHAPLYRMVTALCLVVLLGAKVYRSTSERSTAKVPLLVRLSPFLPWITCALLGAALLINLKRGPWLGVFISGTALGLFVARRMLPITLILVLLLFFLHPTYERVLHLVDDFSIVGGRQNMWTLGAELAERFPLGLGWDNASFMQQFDPQLPPTHRHMHNNLLNITVECGWLGVIVYLWWMVAAIALGIRAWMILRSDGKPQVRSLGNLAFTLSVALLGWQIAGLVEYNFGDGEVRLLALLSMGMVSAIASLTHSTAQKV